MGVNNNECVIVVTEDSIALNKIQNWVNFLEERPRKLFAFIPGLVNNHNNVILAADGSKKGWQEANIVSDLRVEFIKFIEELTTSHTIYWIEVGFGEYGQKVLQGNNNNRYNDDSYFV